MGQAASKVASKSRAVVSRTSSAALADPITGFTRGKGPMILQDAQQAAFLRQQQQKENATTPPPQEMPDDLVRFLNDVGPLQEKRKGDSKPEKRPPRLPRHLLPPEQQQQQPAPKSQAAAVDKTRHQHAMPLAEKIDGFNTMRTTSFSNRQDLHDSTDFGLEILDFYRLLASCSSSKDDTKAADRFYQSQASKLKTQDETLNWTPKQTEEHQALVQQSLQALQLPVILKDTDDSYVGVWPHKVNDYKLLKLQETSKTQVKLVLEDLVEIENAESTDMAISTKVHDL